MFQVVQTDAGKLYRVTYAGMVKEHYQEWQAMCFYEQAMDMWRMRHCLKPGTQKAMDW